MHLKGIKLGEGSTTCPLDGISCANSPKVDIFFHAVLAEASLHQALLVKAVGLLVPAASCHQQQGLVPLRPMRLTTKKMRTRLRSFMLVE